MNGAIVTGANGFVGKAVALELAGRGVEVFAVVRKNAQHLHPLTDVPNLHLVECDMGEYARLETLIPHASAELFYHFAWEGSAGPLRADAEVQLRNVQNACSAVRAAKSLGCKTFLFASSIMEYELEALMRTEKTPPPEALYSIAKHTANHMCRALAGAEKLSYISGLISNIYGPGENSPRLVNTSIRKLLKGEHTRFSPGEQLYDFIYVSDAARAFVHIGEKGLPNKTYYIGNPTPRKLKEFLLDLNRVVAPDQRIGLGELPFDGVCLSFTEFNTRSVLEDTGFLPEVSFCQGVANTVKWIQEEDER